MSILSSDPPAEGGGGHPSGGNATTWLHDLSWGTAGGPSHRSVIIEMPSGYEVRRPRGPTGNKPLMYEAALDETGVGPAEIAEAITAYRVARGASVGWRFLDPQDWSTTADHTGAPSASDDVSIGTGDGSTTVFQLRKPYTESSVTKFRTITKPIPPLYLHHAMIVKVNGVTQNEGADYTVDYNTGAVRFSTAPPNTQPVTAAFTFHVAARFGDRVDSRLEVEPIPGGDSRIHGLDIVELVGAGISASEEINPGGHSIVGFTSSPHQLSFANGTFQELDGHGAGDVYRMPDASSFTTADGGVWLELANISANSCAIKPFGGGTTIVSITTGRTAQFWLSSSNWRVR